MSSEPGHELAAVDAAGSQTKHQVFLLVDRSGKRRAIELKEDPHGRVSYALVAVHEGVVADEREGEACSLVDKRRVQVLPAKGELR
jgi:hypothetical protein